jgi:PBSX family phage portal protein
MSGFEIVRAHADEPMDPEEKQILQSFIDSPNSEECLMLTHSKIIDDYEGIGHGYVEVIRDRVGNPTIWRHAPASLTRLCPKNPDPVLVIYDVVRGRRVSTVREYRTFRMYVQQEGGRLVYFKELGDPRKLDYRTGDYDSPERPVTPGNEATEILHIRQYSEDEYGLPRWISQLPSLLGSREAEEVNLRYFQDNTVPPMILSVAGGRLTAESHADLKKLLNQTGVGKDRQHKIVLVEAVAESDSLDGKQSNVQLKVDKLTDTRPSDGLFSEYDEANQAKIRSSFRLPPAAVGMSQDVTFATANVSLHMAESQVYAPDRQMFDELYNKRLVSSKYGLNLLTVALRSKSPPITNTETSVKALTALNVMGAVTPRSAQQATATILDLDLIQYPEKGEEGYAEWMDMPMALALRSFSGYDKNHAEQGVKDEDTKEVEKDGDVSFDRPEHGQE